MKTTLANGMRNKRYTIMKFCDVLIVVVLLVGYGIWANEAAAKDAEVSAQILEAERAANRGSYPIDGVFAGSAQGYGGLVSVEVTIENGYIEEVAITDAIYEDDAWLEMAMVLPDRIVEEQTTAIDVVSGATYTSSGILNAATKALQKSLNGGE